MNVLVLGAGKMVEAILMGLKEEQDLSHWYIYSPSGVSASQLASRVGAQVALKLDRLEPEWVFIGCKPQQLKDLSILLKNQFKNCLHISLLAALTENDQRSLLGVSRLIRVMPNLAVKIKKGVTLLSSHSAKEELKVIDRLFSNLGTTLVVEEVELDELTLLTGSGPAFFYEFATSVADSFVSLDAEKRELLVRKVLSGAQALADGDKNSLKEMIKAVTSKGGVTEAVLGEWRKDHLKDFITKGIKAGQERREELKASLQS
jgi:pyrroline-5-carboxylate reductase